ncbi:MAG: carboxypeptidase regulatory-like domain-containing protein [Myxococcales bacterium]|nr:MAG: carboxypeptidase regulatory-like domain-containing protein [Myxococcales bacterium]
MVRMKLMSSFALIGMAVALSACDDDQLSAEHSVTLVGQIYDGSNGTTLSDYTLEVIVGDRTLKGSVDTDTGRFRVKGLSAFDDYVVSIVADGYRAFESRNSMVGVPHSLYGAQDIAQTKTHQTLFFESYLFPTSIEAPALDVSIRASDDTDKKLSGTIRLRPSGASEVELGASSVSGQVWGNDLDLQQEVISDSFAEGEISFEAGRLVYGVTYVIDVFGVAGYRSANYYSATSGSTLAVTIVVSPQADNPVELDSNDADGCVLPDISGASLPDAASAKITLTFTSDIELVSESDAQGYVSDYFSIISPDTDIDTERNTLDSTDNGSAITVDGNKLVLSWNPATGLAGTDGTWDPDDALTRVNYEGLTYIEVQRVGSPGSVRYLGELGISSLYCE